MDKYSKMRRITVAILILVIVFIMFPKCIDFAYLIGEKRNIHNTVFEGKDILSYYGSVISIIGTLFLGYITLKQNRELIKMNKKLMEFEEDTYNKKYRPYILLSYIGLNDKEDKDIVYREKFTGIEYNIDYTDIVKVFVNLKNFILIEGFYKLNKCFLTYKGMQKEFVKEYEYSEKWECLQKGKLISIELPLDRKLINELKNEKIVIEIMLKNGYGDTYKEFIEVIISNVDVPPNDKPVFIVDEPKYEINKINLQ